METPMNPQSKCQLLRVLDVAVLLRAAPRTIQIWAESGKLQAFKLGRGWRFREEDVNRFLKAEMSRDPE